MELSREAIIQAMNKDLVFEYAACIQFIQRCAVLYTLVLNILSNDEFQNLLKLHNPHLTKTFNPSIMRRR